MPEGNVTVLPHDEHKCLTCGCPIAREQAEVMVPSRGGMAPRYRHMEYTACQAELRKQENWGYARVPGSPSQ